MRGRWGARAAYLRERCPRALYSELLLRLAIGECSPGPAAGQPDRRRQRAGGEADATVSQSLSSLQHTSAACSGRSPRHW